MSETSIQILTTFIQAAEKSRKYPAGTAASIKSALKLIEEHINDEEKQSVEKLAGNLEMIFHSYYQKNQTKVTAGSLETYKSRVKKLIRDYQQYGTDPSKMASWNPALRIRKPAKKVDPIVETSMEPVSPSTDSPSMQYPGMADMTKFELPLSEDKKIVVFTPSSLKKKDLFKLKGYVTYLESLVDDD